MAVKAQKRLSRHRSRSHQRLRASDGRTTRASSSSSSESPVSSERNSGRAPASQANGAAPEPRREPRHSGTQSSDWDGEPSGISSTGRAHPPTTEPPATADELAPVGGAEALTEDPAALEFFREGDELESELLRGFFAEGDAIGAHSYEEDSELDFTAESPWLTPEQRARRLKFRRVVARLIGTLGVFAAGAAAVRWFS